MDMMDILNQAGGIGAIARELGVDEGTAATGAAALLPAILGGFKGQAQAQPEGLGGLVGMLGGMGGGGLLASVLGAGPSNVDAGNNVLGQISANAVSHFTLSRPVIGNLAFSTLALGASHSCGISTGQLWCWGSNGSGQLGDGVNNALPRYAPTLVSTAVLFDSVTAGSGHSCALTAAGVAHCWGLNSNGQLGDGPVYLVGAPAF